MTNFHPGTVSTLVLQGIREWWQRIQPRNKIDPTINGNLDILHHYGLYVCCHHNVEANGKCLYFCLFEFLSKTLYTEELIWRRWGVGGLLSVSAGGVPVLFRKVRFQKSAFSLTSAVFVFELLGLGRALSPRHSWRERHRQCSKSLSSFWMERKRSVPAEWESRQQKGLCHRCCT